MQNTETGERESWRPAQASLFLLFCIYISSPNSFLERESSPPYLLEIASAYRRLQLFLICQLNFNSQSLSRPRWRSCRWAGRASRPKVPDLSQPVRFSTTDWCLAWVEGGDRLLELVHGKLDDEFRLLLFWYYWRLMVAFGWSFDWWNLSSLNISDWWSWIRVL